MMGDIPLTQDILHAQIHHRQRAVLYEINQLNLSRPGNLQMEVDVRIPKFPLPPSFALQDICSLIESNKLTTHAHIYFHPKYTLDKKGRDELFSDLLRASLIGGDRIVLRGTCISDVPVLFSTSVPKLTRQRARSLNDLTIIIQPIPTIV